MMEWTRQMNSPAGHGLTAENAARPARALLWPVAIGAACGLAAIGVAQMDRAWIGFIMAAFAFALILVAARDTERLLVTTFVLCLQAGAAYRLFYDRGGSEGLAFPLSVLVGVVLVLWYLAAGGVQRLRSCVWAGRLGIPIVALLATSSLSLLTTTERFVGLSRLLTEIELYFIYWLVLNMVQREADVERVVRLLLLTLAIQSVIYFAQSELGTSFTLEGDIIAQGDIPRPGGTVSTNPAGFASFILPILFIAMTRLMMRGRARGRVLVGLLVAAGTIAIGLTYTRAAWVAFAIGSVWLLGVLAHRNTIGARRMLAVVLVAAGVAAVFAPMMGKRDEESPLADAYDERAGLMRIAMNAIAAHPIVGLGPGAYGQVYKAYVPSDLPQQWLYTVHNEYLLRAAETGIPGGIAFVALLIAGFRLAMRLSRARQYTLSTMALGWSAGLLALAWQMYWVPWRGFEYNALLWFMLGLTEAGARIAGASERAGGPRPGQGTGWTEMSVGGGGAGAADANSSAPTSGALPLHGTCTMAPLAHEHDAPENVIEFALTTVAWRTPQPWIWKSKHPDPTPSAARTPLF